MTLGWILAASIAGGTLSAALAAFALYLRASWLPLLISLFPLPTPFRLCFRRSQASRNRYPTP